MDSEDFTPRNIAKDVVTSAIAFKVTGTVKTVVSDHTRFESDSMAVNIAGGLVGSYVAHKCSPITNKVVDKAADFIVAKRAERKQKKTEKDTPEK